MLYTEEKLKKYACPMSEIICETVLDKLKQKQKRLFSRGFKSVSDIKRHDPAAAYYSATLVDKNEDSYTLKVADGFALNIIGPLDKEPTITLAPAADAVFYTLYKDINKKNKDTDYAFKKIARILKRIHADMIKAKVKEADLVTKDDIITLAQQIPDEVYMRFDSLSDKLRYILLQDKLPFDNIFYSQLISAMREFVELEEK